MQSLEHAYEIALFDRARNKLALNAVGQTVRKEAQSLLDHALGFEEVLKSHKELGHIKVGASFTIGNHLATRYLAGYLSQYPQADVGLEIANTPEIVAKVLETPPPGAEFFVVGQSEAEGGPWSPEDAGRCSDRSRTAREPGP